MLHPLDDFPIHQTSAPLSQPVSGDRNHYDRYFFNGYASDGTLYFAAALGLYPNRQVIDAAFSVVVDGVQRNVHASARLAPGERRTRCGPIEVEVVEPMRVLRIRVDGDAHGLGCDLEFRATTPAVEEDRFRRVSGTRPVMDYTRLTQFGTWEGSLQVAPGDVRTLDRSTLGSRDRSWGLRMVGEGDVGAPSTTLPQFFWLWAPINFPSGAVHFDVSEEGDGRRWHESGFRIAPLPDGGGDEADLVDRERGRIESLQADWHIDWKPGTRWADRAELVLTDATGDRERIELEPVLDFLMLGIGYFHPEWSHGYWRGEDVSGYDEWPVGSLDPTQPQHVHIQHLVRARRGDEVGLGILEILAIGEHPSGLHGLFDPA